MQSKQKYVFRKRFQKNKTEYYLRQIPQTMQLNLFIHHNLFEVTGFKNKSCKSQGKSNNFSFNFEKINKPKNTTLSITSYINRQKNGLNSHHDSDNNSILKNKLTNKNKLSQLTQPLSNKHLHQQLYISSIYKSPNNQQNSKRDTIKKKNMGSNLVDRYADLIPQIYSETKISSLFVNGQKCNEKSSSVKHKTHFHKRLYKSLHKKSFDAPPYEKQIEELNGGWMDNLQPWQN